MDGTASSIADTAQTLILLCPTCGSDAAETLGVTGAMDRSLDATVIMQCAACSTVYLSPPPASPGTASQPPTAPVPSQRQIEQWTAGGARDDVVLMLHTLESAISPRDMLHQAASELSAGGKLVVVVSNAGSSSFRQFRGRHWSGYRFPYTRQHFTATALTRLASDTGLAVESIETAFRAETWLESTANWLRDWGYGERVIRFCTGRWFLPRAKASLFEGIAQVRGRGSILVGRLRLAGDAK